MPASKRQKTGKDSSVSTRKDNSESSNTHKDHAASNEECLGQKPPYEYICFFRPFFDLKAENWESDDDLDGDELFDEYRKQFNEQEEKDIALKPAADHKDWKWVIMREGWKIFCDYKRRAKYCNPDNFGMYIYNDWYSWGLLELIENFMFDLSKMLAFDKEFRKGTEISRNQMWAIISALGLWLNDGGGDAFIQNEDGDKVRAQTGLVGCALLTALDALERAGELKPDSKFLDLPLVISIFLEWAHNLDDYGIDGDNASWRSDAVDYFKKAKFDPEKGVSVTAKRLHDLDRANQEEEEEEDDDDDDEPGDSSAAHRGSKKDPWGWKAHLKDFKRMHTVKMGGTQYDITKMSKKERARYAFDGKDPLADVPAHALKEGLLDFE
ncbi:hypothetical protein CC78DRAFT_613362 [Lojkania enalia]|uniref:Uncharacterized protein n=1 Tax=Lojkania enalia TaxID=147567 RepID=A0A9P4KFE5_9PLEO|nr:hypothetical protein CC78DRAFT_613362 [Didymosphaeria enalia]